MFETAELGHRVPKSVYRKAEPRLREELLALQQQLRRLDHSQVIIVLAGVDGAGKGETVNLLNEWMDPRWLMTRVFDEPADTERERPKFWRFWLALPPRGRIGMFLSSWYSQPVLDRVYQRIDERSFDDELDQIIRFEEQLAADHAVILKFWMHLSRDAQKTRLETLEADPLMRGRVTERDWTNWHNYDRFIAVAERTIMRTNTGRAPWTIVEGVDPCYRALTLGGVLRDALKRRIERIQHDNQVAAALAARAVQPSPGKRRKGGGKARDDKPPATPKVVDAHRRDGDTLATSNGDGPLTVLSRLDMSLRLPKARYNELLLTHQAELRLLHREARARGISTIMVFEGPDAAGKGSAIRRVNASLEARNYQVHGIAAPTDEERAQHYLWRFWRHLSRAGRITIFDRSWYGRVLVERVEGFASEDEWRRAYVEINDFENQLTAHGIVLLKFWIHVTRDEQLKRFREREKVAHKSWKLTEEDWRNRERWDDYEHAVHDMVQYTSTQSAPWTLVEGNDKRHARVKVLQTICQRLGDALDAHPVPAPADDPASSGRPPGDAP